MIGRGVGGTAREGGTRGKRGGGRGEAGEDGGKELCTSGNRPRTTFKIGMLKAVAMASVRTSCWPATERESTEEPLEEEEAAELTSRRTCTWYEPLRAEEDTRD